MHRVKFVRGRWRVPEGRVKIPAIKRGTREEQQATVTTMDKWYLLWRPAALLGPPTHEPPERTGWGEKKEGGEGETRGGRRGTKEKERRWREGRATLGSSVYT